MFHCSGELGVDELAADLVGRGDHRPARLAGAEERVALRPPGGRVVDDVARLSPWYWLRSQVSIQNDSMRTISFCSSPIEPDTSIM
jgi:hypothetical protein